MFVNIETGRPAWLLSQDGGGVVYSTVDPSESGSERHHHGTAPHLFFGAHREATADEMAGKVKPAAGVVTMPMHQAAPAAPVSVTPGGLVEPKGFADDPPGGRPAPKTKAKAKAKAKAAPKAKAAKRKPAAKAKPPADKPAATKPADQAAGADNPPPPGAGPHGEQGRD